MDTLSQAERSERMGRVRGKDTKVKLRVRRLVHRMGYRYRLHARDLPGYPDMVFRRRKKALFVHGRFWHRHEHCALARLPKSRHDFWVPKLEGNKQRDARKQDALRALGWDVLVVWECESKDEEGLRERIMNFLGPTAWRR